MIFLYSGFFFFLILFIDLFLAVLGLHHCTGFFSNFSEWGLLPSCSALASHLGGLSYCGAQPLWHEGFYNCGMWPSEVAAPALESTESLLWCLDLVA